MKKIIGIIGLIALLASCATTKPAELDIEQQNAFSGSWYGVLDAGTVKLELVLNIEKSAENGLSASFDSISQGVKDIKADRVEVQDGRLIVTFKRMGAVYEGTLSEQGILEGTWTQGGSVFTLSLENKEISADTFRRPQDPAAPYGYKAVDVSFYNQSAAINLAGTLTYPENGEAEFGVVLVSGSGSQNRDEEIFNHRPFLVIADYLTRNGIAVLRYDDRGFAESEGDAAMATTVDFASDADAAVNYLAAQDFVKIKTIGVMGHSEGGIIAPYVANRNSNVGFIVMLAGTGVPGNQITLKQSEVILRQMGTPETDIAKTTAMNKSIYETVLSSEPESVKKEKISSIMAETGAPQQQIDAQVSQLLSPWFTFFLGWDPRPELEALKVPALVLNGSLDLQVDPQQNLTAIEEAFKSSGKTNYIIHEFAGLNHLFQPTETGLPQEYGTIETTFAEEVLEYIDGWIGKLK